jgi:hypothetical protein
MVLAGSLQSQVQEVMHSKSCLQDGGIYTCRLPQVTAVHMVSNVTTLGVV